MSKQEMDIFELIKKDHRLVESIFSEMEKTDKPKNLRDLFVHLYKELSVHAQAEELTFYPAMREYQETEELLEEAEEEHVEAKVMLEEIKSLEPASSEFKAKIRKLKSAIQHHVEEEENQIFPTVRECMTQPELAELTEDFKKAKSKLLEEIAVASL